uniref:Uncharacterized protein n=1 Tax=Molossus molossus TaxID=27622 RepID=A0A7J8ESC9_MOLMO|nr:hypothetical protein HJG59_008689 [Molossus molossus]
MGPEAEKEKLVCRETEAAMGRETLGLAPGLPYSSGIRLDNRREPSAYSIPHSWSKLQEQHTGIRSSLILYLQHSSKSVNQVQKKRLLYPGLASDILPISCNYILFIYPLLFLWGGKGWGMTNEPKKLVSKAREISACRETKEVTLPLVKGSQELCSS